MRTLRFPSGLRSVVCLGAHPDDIEIGAGATIATLADAFPDAEFRFIILTGSDARRQEAVTSARELLGDRAEVSIGSFEDGFIPYDDAAAAKRFVRSSMPTGAIDLVLAPQLGDSHQDHRYLAELAGQLFRDNLILGYEIVKYDGGLVAPNVYVQITEEVARKKVAHLRRSFPSQLEHHWFTEDAFLGLMRIRGIESRAPGGYAEAFISSKMVLG